jgi:hypothetical protein
MFRIIPGLDRGHLQFFNSQKFNEHYEFQPWANLKKKIVGKLKTKLVPISHKKPQPCGEILNPICVDYNTPLTFSSITQV